MSGGRFRYMDSELKDTIFHYAEKPVNVFEDREISNLVWDVLDLIHDYDWYASGDTREETWIKAKADFKAKWFKKKPEVRVREIIDTAVEELREELYKTFGEEVGGDGG